MAITSFSTLKSAVADWLDRDDMGDAIETMIGLAEARIYRELRIQAMETAISETISSGVVAVPSGFQEWRFAYIATSAAQQLQPKSPEWIYRHYPVRSSSGLPSFIAREGSSFIFGPYPDSSYTLDGTYFASLTTLSTANETNWFTNNAPDLLLYGTLAHSAGYIGEDERIGIWEGAYQTIKARVIEQDRGERWPAQMTLAATTA